MLVMPIRVLALDIDGVLTDGRVSLTPGGGESKGLSFRDLDAITQARRAGLQIALVTGENGEMVDVVAGRIAPDRIFRGAKDKHGAVHALADDLGLGVESICYVGDADRDAPALACVGLGLAPSDASQEARRRAKRVLKSKGGSGAVAEAVGLVLDLVHDAQRAPALEQRMQEIAEQSVEAHRRFVAEAIPGLRQVAQVFIRALRGGHKILLCGNGGSAADAQHVAGELIGRFLKESEPWPAIALSADSSVLTCIGNDWSFDDVFARQVRALAAPGDVVVGISTSGNSTNVLRAMEAARGKGAVTVGFTGERSCRLPDVCDVCFCAPATATPRIQELHILGWHAVCEVVEASLMDSAA